jgi:hypothetical protein
VAQGVEALYQNDDQAVILWVERLPPGEVREEAVVGMVKPWARHDPEAASQWVEEQADPANLDGIRALLKSVVPNPDGN